MMIHQGGRPHGLCDLRGCLGGKCCGVVGIVLMSVVAAAAVVDVVVLELLSGSFCDFGFGKFDQYVAHSKGAIKRAQCRLCELKKTSCWAN